MKKLSLQTTKYIVSQIQMDLDLQMLVFDLWGTIAHTLMLYKQNIISEKQAKNILKALKTIKQKVNKSEYEINPAKGSQLSLEASVIELAGEDGKAMHTARSRNDQVMTTELLFLKEKTLLQLDEIKKTIELLVKLSQKHQKTVMSGYTHMQPAKMTSFAQWCLAYAKALLRSASSFQYYYDQYNICPLGACEGYGTSWNINREYTAKLLGFSKVWDIPQDVVSSRGFYQLGLLKAQEELTLVMSKIAQDLLLFNTFEFGFVSLGENIAQRLHPITGSSIMAQKKNPDVLELIRSSSSNLSGLHSGLAQTLSKLPMGYNRDSREAKEYVSQGFSKTEATLSSLQEVLATIEVNKEKMLQLVEANYSLTTELADFISQETKIPYRTIYKIVGNVVAGKITNKQLVGDITIADLEKEAKKQDLSINLSNKQIQSALSPDQILQKRKHIGGSATQMINTSTQNIFEEIKLLDFWIAAQWKIINKAKQLTKQKVEGIVKS